MFDKLWERAPGNLKIGGHTPWANESYSWSIGPTDSACF